MDPCNSKAEITEAIQLGKSAHHRLDEHKERMDASDKNYSVLHEMNTNIKLIVQQNGYRDTKVDSLEKDVNVIMNKPLQTYEKVKWIVIGVVLSSIVIAGLSSWLGQICTVERH